MSTAAPPPAIRIRGLRVERGGATILHDLDLTVERGTVTGLLGPSGCGKTTLMRAIVGVQVVKAGAVTVLDRPGGSSSVRREVGYVTQTPSVYADLTVLENVRYFARIADVGDDAAARTLHQVGLGARGSRLVGTLSGGQRGRVSLACALVAGPALLVLDEPTVGLDPVLRRDLWATFHELAAQGTTLLVSSHAMDEAARCDHLLLMRDGRLLAAGTPHDLLAATGAEDIEGAFLALVSTGQGALA